MKVVTAPENSNGYWSVFLAGGISGCTNWQAKVIAELEHLSECYNLSNVAIYNPRRDDFDVTDRTAEIEQIKWEHSMLTKADVLSIFFANSDSVQPITLYEFGRFCKVKGTIPVVTVQKGYKRERDVLIRCALDRINVTHISSDEAIQCHAQQIVNAIKRYRGN